MTDGAPALVSSVIPIYLCDYLLLFELFIFAHRFGVVIDNQYDVTPSGSPAVVISHTRYLLDRHIDLR